MAKDGPKGGSSTAERAAVLRDFVIGDEESVFTAVEAVGDGAGDVIDAAAERAQRVLGRSATAPAFFAADALTALAIEYGWSACDVDAMVLAAARAAGTDVGEARRQIFLHATHSPRVLELPPRVAMEFHLALLTAVGGVQAVSLWTGGASSRLECILSSGGNVPTRRARTIARQTLAADTDADLTSGLICGVRVLRWQRPCAALVVRRSPGDERALALAAETAAALAPIFEREMLLERNARRERMLVEASERRLARIGYDVHDGPLQDVAVLLAELQVARRTLRERLPEQYDRIVDARLAAIEEHANEVNIGLRELAVSLEPSHVLELPFATVVEREVEGFARRTGVEAQVEVNGDFGQLTASQRLAFYRVVQEALTNVREHSGASVVHVSLEARRTSTELRVIDNGTGFDVTRVLVDAARRGRLGLVGIGERVRMLGGTFDVISRCENYTELYVSLPVWRPEEARAAVEDTEAI